MADKPDLNVPDEERGKFLRPEDQVRHQTWKDPARLSIQIDCPPFAPRPPEVFASAIEDTGLTPPKISRIRDQPYLDAVSTW